MQKQKKVTSILAVIVVGVSLLRKVNTMTNFEKIKQMSIDEMARSCMSFFACPYGRTPYFGCPMEKRFNGSCIDCTKHWLESEADSNDTR